MVTMVRNANLIIITLVYVKNNKDMKNNPIIKNKILTALKIDFIIITHQKKYIQLISRILNILLLIWTLGTMYQ